MAVTARRLLQEPIVRPHMDDRMGTNINGPSLIAAPPWLQDPPGRYYLYFADHKGGYIRLAYGDAPEGPWRIHRPGCLDLADSHFCRERPDVPGPEPDWAKYETDWLYPHIASPDVHVDAEKRQVRMYFHGLMPDGGQMTRVALSDDGLSFRVQAALLGPSYFRVFRHGGWHYAFALPNRLLRSRDGLTDFEAGPTPLPPKTRHTAVLLRGERLHVFWSEIGDTPERLYHGSLDLSGDWQAWRLTGATEILRPERPWEGAGLPLEASHPGAAESPVRQLRDPCIFEEGARVYLLYSGAGEGGIGLAEVEGL